MPRGMHDDMLAAIIAGTVRVVIFFEGEFASGPINVWTGLGEIEWDGKTWQGIGALGSVSPVTETGAVRATGISVGLSGIPSSLISVVYAEARQGKSGKCWLACLDEDGAIVANPYRFFSGKLDVPTDRDDGETAQITISYESRLVDLERPRERRYTPEDAKIDYPDDKGFDFVASLQDAQIVWGRS